MSSCCPSFPVGKIGALCSAAGTPLFPWPLPQKSESEDEALLLLMEVWLVYACPRIPNPQVFLVISGVPVPTRTIKCQGGHGPAYSANESRWSMTCPLQHSDRYCESQPATKPAPTTPNAFFDMIRLYLRQISQENIQVNNHLQSSLLRM